MAKVKATKSKAVGKKSAKPSKRKQAPKSASKTKSAASTGKTAVKAKPKAAANAKANAKGKKGGSTILGGVAKGFAWLGDKVRGVVAGKKPAKKNAKRGKGAKPAKTAKTVNSNPPVAAEPAAAPASDGVQVTLNNPLP